ncbi:GNAT family N-acetyltransferase [Aquabacterium sp.]|uniref:GNAT family N-acetyltransferase n=1 Tax=Aquabacterium sp. TaxID=1872578 RepID=UPI002BC1C96C|nr:GNAT family N-acetyltransferase [Aquabacterium sp.]HSW03481.1 GNAT family N-acetyltransferase [Aquabacterium sp.]
MHDAAHSFDIAAVPRAQWAALAAFAFQANQRDDGQVRCLHFEQGSSPQALADEMLGHPDGEALFLSARPLARADSSAWLGTIGAVLAPELGRAWLRGPLLAPGFAAADALRASALARSLIVALRDALPPVIVRLDAFPQADEALLCAAYAAEGFEDRLVNHVLCATAPDTPAAGPAWPASVADSAGDHKAALEAAALHAADFPEGYLTPDTLLSTRDDEHRLLVARHPDGDGDVVGYLYVQHDRAAGDAYIDFLAVAPSARRRGTGRALIAAACHWAFVQRGLPRVTLTVRSDRAPALALYRSAGFVEVAAGRHLCARRAAAEPTARS